MACHGLGGIFGVNLSVGVVHVRVHVCVDARHNAPRLCLHGLPLLHGVAPVGGLLAVGIALLLGLPLPWPRDFLASRGPHRDALFVG
jgi:hypothetical protein